MHAPVEFADIAADVLARIKGRAPRVHCITNSVAQAYTANVLLATGAVPSMTIAPEEIAAFVAGADALLVNLGTLDPERRAAIAMAVAAAGDRVPWVLDPVFIDRSPERAQFARERGAGLFLDVEKRDSRLVLGKGAGERRADAGVEQAYLVRCLRARGARLQQRSCRRDTECGQE